MNSVKKTRRKAVSLILIICMLVAVVAGCSGQPAKADDFSLWVKDAKSLAALKSYVSEVTNKNSKNFIPEEDRIAVCNTAYQRPDIALELRSRLLVGIHSQRDLHLALRRGE